MEPVTAFVAFAASLVILLNKFATADDTFLRIEYRLENPAPSFLMALIVPFAPVFNIPNAFVIDSAAFDSLSHPLALPEASFMDFLKSFAFCDAFLISSNTLSSILGESTSVDSIDSDFFISSSCLFKDFSTFSYFTTFFTASAYPFPEVFPDNSKSFCRSFAFSSELE